MIKTLIKYEMKLSILKHKCSWDAALVSLSFCLSCPKSEERLSGVVMSPCGLTWFKLLSRRKRQLVILRLGLISHCRPSFPLGMRSVFWFVLRRIHLLCKVIAAIIVVNDPPLKTKSPFCLLALNAIPVTCRFLIHGLKSTDDLVSQSILEMCFDQQAGATLVIQVRALTRHIFANG